jgi:hypothetical protein
MVVGEGQIKDSLDEGVRRGTHRVGDIPGKMLAGSVVDVRHLRRRCYPWRKRGGVDDPMRISEHPGKRGIRHILIEHPVHLTLPHRDLLGATRHEVEQTIAGGAERPGDAVFKKHAVGDRLLLGQPSPEDIPHVLQRLGGKEQAPSDGLRAIGTHYEIKLSGVTICEVYRHGIASGV